MTAASVQADRFARARQEFAEATERGCTILRLRELKAAERLALRQRAHAEVADRTADLMDAADTHQGDFLAFDAPWMMRD